MQKFNWDIAVKLIGAFVAVVGSVLPLVISSLRERSAANEHDRELEQGIKLANYVEAWLKAQELVGTPDHLASAKLIARQELDHSLQKIAEMSRRREKAHVPHQERSRLQRWFLLFFPSRLSGWVVHTLFYLILFLLIIGTLGSFINDAGNFSLAHLKTEWTTLLSVYVVFAIPLLVLRAVAMHIERKTQEERKAKQESAAKNFAPVPPTV